MRSLQSFHATMTEIDGTWRIGSQVREGYRRPNMSKNGLRALSQHSTLWRPADCLSRFVSAAIRAHKTRVGAEIRNWVAFSFSMALEPSPAFGSDTTA
jgi:hypothetical protein